ncbi:MAG: tetratricopeptide repeat protein [Bacteroidota bacterium]
MNNKSSKTKTTSASVNSTNTVKWIRIALVILGFILYGASVGFDYTLDDEIFILKNKTVQDGISGIVTLFTKGSLSDFGIQPYRPVTLTSFAIEKSFFDNAAGVRHFFNILFYILLLQVLYSLLLQLFNKSHPLYVGLLVLLFAAHPLHTEAVSSIKGRDELFAALFALLAWKSLLTFRENDKTNYKQLIIGSIFFALSCFSKESGIVFLAIIPLWNFMMKDQSIKNNLLLTTPLLLMAMLYLFARQQVIGHVTADRDVPVLANVLNATQNIGELTATKSVILYYYIKLLVMPWPLVWDYSYNQISVSNWSHLLPWISAITYITLIIICIHQWKRNSIVSFFLLFFFITCLPTNNLLFTTGCTMGERFLFVPSLAFIIILAHYLVQFTKSDLSTDRTIKKSMAYKIILGITILFSGMSIARSNDWKNNFTLFESSVKASPNSARTHYSLASEYLSLFGKTVDVNQRNVYIKKAITHFERSLEILPDNFQTLYNAGLCYSLNGDTLKAIQAYQKSIALNDIYTNSMNNLAVLYEGQGNLDSAFYYYQMALKITPNEKSLLQNISNLYYNKGLRATVANNINLAIEEYRKSIYYAPQNVMAINNCASLHAGKNEVDSCLYYLKMGYQIEPSNLMIIENIAAMSFVNKNYNQAIEYANKALALTPKARKSIGVLADTYQAIGNSKEAVRYRAMLNNQ